MQYNTSKVNWTSRNTNTTTTTSTQSDVTGPVVVTALLLAATIWILLSLIRYGIITRKWKTTPKEEYQKVGRVYSSATLCTVLCLLRFIVTEIHINLKFNDNNVVLCNTLSIISGSLNAFVIFFVYFFLWIRQRAFYGNTMLRKSYNKWVKYLSKFCIIPFLITFIAALLYSVISNRYEDTRNNCMSTPRDLNARIIFTFALSISVVFWQSLLLGLFVYALTKNGELKWNFCKQKNNKKLKNIYNIKTLHLNANVPVSSTEIIQNSPKTPQRIWQPEVSHNSQSTLISVLKKTFVFAVLSTFIDLVMLFINFFLNGSAERQFFIMIVNIYDFLKLIFVLLSFHSWKEILFFPCMKT